MFHLFASDTLARASSHEPVDTVEHSTLGDS